MKRLFIMFLAALVLGSFAAGALALDLSGEFLNKTGKTVTKGKIFLSENKARMESMGSVMILRMDKKVVWMLMPKQKMFIEQVMESKKSVGLSNKVEGETKREKLGEETVNGMKCDKFKVTFKTGDKTETVLQWISKEFSFPVKTASPDGKWSMEFTKLSKAPQPGSLFEVPSGFKKMAFKMPAGM